MTFEEARAAFPVLERLAYLNAGTNGPIARATAEAMVAQTLVDLTEGRAGMGYYAKTRELRERVRGQLAGLIGVPAENVALTTSTTNGCNIVLGGLGLGPGDEVVTTDEEHFGLLGPLHVCGVRVRVAATRGLVPADALDRLLDAVTPKTRLLALSHVSWVTGNELPIAALREQTGLPLLVDGAQSGGAIAVDATPYDYYTVSGQKWPCGPDSTGALYIRDVDSLRVCAPTYFSQASFDPDGAFDAVRGRKAFRPRLHRRDAARRPRGCARRRARVAVRARSRGRGPVPGAPVRALRRGDGARPVDARLLPPARRAGRGRRAPGRARRDRPRDSGQWPRPRVVRLLDVGRRPRATSGARRRLATARPSSSAEPRIAAITFAMCWSRSSPSSSAPA